MAKEPEERPEGGIRHIIFAQAVRTAIREELARDPNVIVFGEDVGVYGGVYGVTRGLMREFGEDRVRDTPISETAIAGIAVGAALLGLRPVAEIMYCDFLTQASDAIVNNAAKYRYMSGGQFSLPLVIRTPAGGGSGYAAQHSQCLEHWFAGVPGLKVIMPAMPADARGLMKSAIRDDDPVVFIEHKAMYFHKGPVPAEETLVPIGVADVKRPGTDVTLVAWSMTLWYALEAAEKLEKDDGISVEVVDPRSLLPLDADTIVKSVAKTGRLVVAHEAPIPGGFGAEICAQVTDKAWGHLKTAPVRVGSRFAPVPFAKPLEDYVIPQVDDIAAAVRQAIA